MKLTVRGNKLEVTDSIRNYVEEKSCEENLLDIDSITKSLFLQTFNVAGESRIKKGEEIGDVKYNGEL